MSRPIRNIPIDALRVSESRALALVTLECAEGRRLRGDRGDELPLAHGVVARAAALYKFPVFELAVEDGEAAFLIGVEDEAHQAKVLCYLAGNISKTLSRSAASQRGGPLYQRRAQVAYPRNMDEALAIASHLRDRRAASSPSGKLDANEIRGKWIDRSASSRIVYLRKRALRRTHPTDWRERWQELEPDVRREAEQSCAKSTSFRLAALVGVHSAWPSLRVHPSSRRTERTPADPAEETVRLHTLPRSVGEELPTLSDLRRLCCVGRASATRRKRRLRRLTKKYHAASARLNALVPQAKFPPGCLPPTWTYGTRFPIAAEPEVWHPEAVPP